MALTNKQIESLLCKDIKSKTILVKLDELENVINEHLKDGWELKNKTELNGRIKVTFVQTK